MDLELTYKGWCAIKPIKRNKPLSLFLNWKLIEIDLRSWRTRKHNITGQHHIKREVSDEIWTMVKLLWCVCWMPSCFRTSPSKNSNTVLRQLGSLSWLKITTHTTSSPSSVTSGQLVRSVSQSKKQSAKNNNPASAADMLFYASSGK